MSSDTPEGRAASATSDGSVVAVVLTHLRPRLAGDVVRMLLDVEGLPPKRVVVVVNGAGGLDDEGLESAVTMRRLPHNLGPAGGFREALEQAFAEPTVRWAYLCEDDVALFRIPLPRVSSLVARAGAYASAEGCRRPVGLVTPCGRRFVGRGHTLNVRPPPGSPFDLVPVDVAGWNATLVSRDVFEAGVLPSDEWFFGYEDFDFCCKVSRAGFSVLVDGASARAIADQLTNDGREQMLRSRRPADSEEPWRAYYTARNFIQLARRHGSASWLPWHLAYSARRVQLAPTTAERLAILRGLWDGALGRMGPNPRFQRTTGELVAPTETRTRRVS